MPRLNSQHTSQNTNCPLASEEFVVASRAYQLHISAGIQLMGIQKLQIGCLFK